jgi:hypothetical protein
MKILSLLAVACAAQLAAREASAQPVSPPKDSGAVDGEGAAQPKLGASNVPAWALRGLSVTNVVRVDTVTAMSSQQATPSNEQVTFLSGCYRLNDNFGVSAKWGFWHYAPNNGAQIDAYSNPAAYVNFAVPIDRHFSFAAIAGLSAPIGSGGGNSPDSNVYASVSATKYAKAMLENSLLSPNEVGVPLGFDFGYREGRFTAQLEANMSVLARVKGEAKTPDSARIPAWAAAMVGYFILPELSAAAELRYTTSLTTTAAIAKDPSTRDNMSFAVGVRGYVRIANNIAFRPGVSYGRGIEGRLNDLGYQYVQVDFPMVF